MKKYLCHVASKWALRRQTTPVPPPSPAGGGGGVCGFATTRILFGFIFLAANQSLPSLETPVPSPGLGTGPGSTGSIYMYSMLVDGGASRIQDIHNSRMSHESASQYQGNPSKSRMIGEGAHMLERPAVERERETDNDGRRSPRLLVAWAMPPQADSQCRPGFAAGLEPSAAEPRCC